MIQGQANIKYQTHIRFVVLRKVKNHTAVLVSVRWADTNISKGSSASIFTVEKYQYYPIIRYKEIHCMFREAFD